jgi:mannose-6-phosphate isomerase
MMIDRDDTDVTRKVFHSFVHCEDLVADVQLELLISHLLSKELRTYEEELMLRLHAQFPGDRGCMCALLLNVLKLQPGQALYMGPNEPHSYISGDLGEHGMRIATASVRVFSAL